MDEGLDAGCEPGGIARLLEVIEGHPAEFAYDFRRFFGVSFEAIGDGISWAESVFLVAVMLRDPNSWTQAVRAGWKYPVSREWIVGAHTYDLHARVNSKTKPKPYPNPFPDKDKMRVGKTTKTFTEVRTILEWMNPKETPNGD